MAEHRGKTIVELIREDMFYHQTDPAAWPAKTGDQNRADKTEQIRCGAATGLLAYRAGQPAGWCNAGPRSAYPLRHADLDLAAPDADRVGAGVCFLIAPAQRGQGIARFLLDAACPQLAAAGYTTVEAYPRKAEEASAANYHGPLALYIEAGFHPRRGFDDAYVMRRPLTGQAA